MYKNSFEPEQIHHTFFSETSNKRNFKKLSLGVFKLQFLFDIEKFSTKVAIVVIVSIFTGFYNFLLLERTGLYSLGINAFFQSIVRLIGYCVGNSANSANSAHSIMFWGMALVSNAPLAIFSYKKIGVNFTFLSICSIAVSSITAITLSNLPSSWGLKDFYIFSDPRTFNKCLTDQKINILQWSSISTVSKNGGSNVSIALNDSSNVALMFFYGFIFGVLNTFSSLIIYALGGSTGGFDWMVFYLSKKRNYLVNNLFLYLSLGITFVSYLIGTYIPYLHHMLSSSHNNGGNCFKSLENQIQLNGTFNKQNNVLISTFIGPTFVATVIAAFTKKILFGIFYPRFKMINVRIFTNKVSELRNLLIKSNFPHTFTITQSTGGYLLRKQHVFEVICFALELKMLKEYIRKIDPSCLIIASPVKSLNGTLNVIDNIN